jgi:hypothetical protein
MRPGLSWRILERGTARGPRNPTNSPPSKLIHFLRSPGGLAVSSAFYRHAVTRDVLAVAIGCSVGAINDARRCG